MYASNCTRSGRTYISRCFYYYKSAVSYRYMSSLPISQQLREFHIHLYDTYVERERERLPSAFWDVMWRGVLVVCVIIYLCGCIQERISGCLARTNINTISLYTCRFNSFVNLWNACEWKHFLLCPLWYQQAAFPTKACMRWWGSKLERKCTQTL